MQESERAKLLNQAMATYDIEFFKQYSFTGENAALLAQKSLEDFFEKSINSSEEANLLLLSMIE